jgi:ABC-type transport system substrate-binding protein
VLLLALAAGGTVSAVTNAWGVTMPADAAPLDQQFLRLLETDGTTADFAVSVYNRVASSFSSVLTTPLLRIDKNFQVQPNGALSYEASKDGKTWTFHLNPALTWSDGNPVTADDVVFTFQYQADPKHAWDFAWFWSDIVNWDDAVAGKVPTSSIGVKKVDTYTVTFTTTVPSPYFPSKAIYVRPLSKIAFGKAGEYYNNDPKTSVSSSPWILQEWTKGQRIVFAPNKKYTGKLRPYIQYLIYNLAPDNTTQFNAYLNNEIDMADTFTPANIATVSKDPQLNKEYHPGYGDFRTYYLGFDTTKPPFNDLRVRQAFAKAVDRDTIIKNVVGRQGMAAYSFLMPGFPDANSTALKNEDVNKFDVAKAKSLLSEAGYPGGKGFPSLELWLRQESDLNKAIGEAIASMLRDNLGINLQVSNKETKLFMDSLNAHNLPFYYLSYGFDYLDPSNMLGIWVTGGRHTWSNPQFDTLMKDATSLSGNTAKRDQEFKDAEKILVDDVGGIFIYHVTPGNIYKPYMKGTELDPDKTGVSAWHWPGMEDAGALNSSLYVSNDVPKDRHM